MFPAAASFWEIQFQLFLILTDFTIAATAAAPRSVTITAHSTPRRACQVRHQSAKASNANETCGVPSVSDMQILARPRWEMSVRKELKLCHWQHVQRNPFQRLCDCESDASHDHHTEQSKSCTRPNRPCLLASQVSHKLVMNLWAACSSPCLLPPRFVKKRFYRTCDNHQPMLLGLVHQMAQVSLNCGIVISSTWLYLFTSFGSGLQLHSSGTTLLENWEAI